MKRPCRILVIDDEAAVRANVMRFLQLEGYLASEAEDGERGIQAALRSPPDLVLCDLMMPGVDGFGVLARLRAEPSTAGVPFVFLTASADMEDSRVGFLLGANEYITKPFSLAVLGAIIEQKLDASKGPG
ncbi:MAG: response regulator [Sulfuritalea sp.]|nr:response regulator [Sulfuritalea sp.]